MRISLIVLFTCSVYFYYNTRLCLLLTELPFSTTTSKNLKTLYSIKKKTKFSYVKFFCHQIDVFLLPVDPKALANYKHDDNYKFKKEARSKVHWVHVKMYICKYCFESSITHILCMYIVEESIANTWFKQWKNILNQKSRDNYHKPLIFSALIQQIFGFNKSRSYLETQSQTHNCPLVYFLIPPAIIKYNTRLRINVLIF